MDFSFLSRTILFRGTTPAEIEEMLGCLGATTRHFAKGETIYRAGDTVRCMGLVLGGSVHIESDDLWGNKSVLSHIAPGQIFAETYASLPGEPLMVNVVAAQAAEILFLDTSRVLQTCPAACPHHAKLLRNLLAVMAQKNLNLSHRMFHTAPKSIRGRLIAYLSFEATRQGSYRVTVPFNRQQLADYLNVDRSALSAELGKMQRDGLLRVEKNTFELYQGRDAQGRQKNI